MWNYNAGATGKFLQESASTGISCIESMHCCDISRQQGPVRRMPSPLYPSLTYSQLAAQSGSANTERPGGCDLIAIVHHKNTPDMPLHMIVERQLI